ncbi:MAG TPA: recombinase family protein [Feifaniaceae bacterium]|nr:recombinase family protein [Feifaniaceae bacterium]
MRASIEDIRAQLLLGRRLADIPLRATYYARVSTDRDEQRNSLNNQKAYFEEKMRSNPAWTFVPGYVDEGVTGTSTKKRTEFLRMVADAKAGAFDLILTKEVSRFARDLLDSIAYTRELLRHGVGVLFEDTGLNTMEADSEFRLAIMATVAQEESRRLSERVKFGWKRSQEAGKRHGATAPIGYVFNDKTNGYDIDPETAPAVKYIYRRYAENIAGTRTIAQELKALGYVNRSGNMYHPGTIRRIVENPLYKGYIVSRKSVTLSYRSLKKRYRPPEEWLLHFDPARVPPLVTEEEWEAARQVARLRKKFMEGADCGAQKAGGKYPYTGKLFCAEHRCNYQRAQQQWFADGVLKKRGYWRCACYKRPERPARCAAPLLYTDRLDALMRGVFAALIDESPDFSLADAVQDAFSARYSEPAGTDERLAQLQNKKAKLLKGWMDGVIRDADYRALDEEITGKLRTLEERKKQSAVQERQISGKGGDLLQKIPENAALHTPEILEELIRCLVKQIRIEPIPNEAGAYALVIEPDIPGMRFSGMERFVVCDPKESLPQGSGT